MCVLRRACASVGSVLWCWVDVVLGCCWLVLSLLWLCAENSTLPNFDQDLATFLLIRGPHAWLGYG